MMKVSRIQESVARERSASVLRSSRRRRLVSLIICLLFLIYPPLFDPLGESPGHAEERGAPKGAAQRSQDDYLIGPGDVLEILVWKEPDLSRTVRVRLDGKISLPLMDDIQAANSTLLQLKERITEALRGYVDAPSVYVILQENRSKKIYIVGKVNAPGEYVIEKDTSLLQAIAMAGGFAEWADKGDIVVMRKGPQGQFRIKVDYRRAVSGKDTDQNILLQPDDIIIVP
jgi:polysaccharide biosynthesis/export protein